MTPKGRSQPVPAPETVWILQVDDAGESRSLRLPPGAVRTVGRGAQADFVLNDPLASRVHCRLSASGRQLVVEDLGSTNGTFVNGSRAETVGLEGGDRLRVGRSEFIVRGDDATSDGDADASGRELAP